MYFNGLLLLSAQFVRIATKPLTVRSEIEAFVSALVASAHRVQIATLAPRLCSQPGNFVSAHRVQIATGSG